MAKTALKRDIDYCLVQQLITKLPEISGFSRTKAVIEKNTPWASLVAQWLRVCLLMQGTRVRALVWDAAEQLGP